MGKHMWKDESNRSDRPPGDNGLIKASSSMPCPDWKQTPRQTAAHDLGDRCGSWWVTIGSRYCAEWKTDSLAIEALIGLNLESPVNTVMITALLYPPNNKVVGGYIGFTPSVCPSVSLSRLSCPLCNIYSSGWILSILATNDHYHVRVCHTQWPLTLTYIFKVIRPWLRKSCPLYSIYSSGWILFIFGTNDHYH